MISWNGIKSRAMAFAREWVDVSSEDAEAKTVWNEFPDACLADLYDPLTMPQALLKAHQQLDKAVDAAYGKKIFSTEADRVAFLFDLYEKYTR
jgi:hypothetical protein